MKSILATVLIAKVENLDDDFVRSDLLARNVDSRYLHTSLSRVHYEKKSIRSSEYAERFGRLIHRTIVLEITTLMRRGIVIKFNGTDNIGLC